MTCHLCQAEKAKKFGRDRRGNQRYKCRSCRRTFGERRPRMLPADMRIPDLATNVDRYLYAYPKASDGG
jgi:hypothetical protein